MKTGIVVLIALCAFLYPAASISRWFTSSYYDLRVTLRRYARCEGNLHPMKKQGLSETEFFVDQIRLFLDEANYDNEQLANITAFMGTICRYGDNGDMDYPVSVHVDINRYSNGTTKGKAVRCKGIDRVMDSMFGVFKRAALNKSEPLDFSTIQFAGEMPDSPADSYYNLTDLVNTLWISSGTLIDDTCNITRSITEYVQSRSSNSTAQDRSQSGVPQGFMGTLFDFIDRLLDPLLGFQKRFYWEGTNTVEVLYMTFGDRIGQVRDGLGRGYKSTRDRLSNVFTYGVGSNSTAASNSTNLSSNMTSPMNITTSTVSSSSTTTTASTTTVAPQVPQVPQTVSVNKTVVPEPEAVAAVAVAAA